MWMRFIAPILAAALVATVSAVETTSAQPERPAEVHHIHGLAVDRGDPDLLYVATHTGLFRLGPKGSVERVGSHHFDLMGFTVHPRDANLVFASGHPDVNSFKQFQTGNLGLLVSRDGGANWQSVVLKGEADFHALAYTPRNGGELYGWSVAGETGLHRISVTTWKAERLAARGLADVLSLAAGPTEDGLLVAGVRTGLLVSRDWGDSWSRLAGIAQGRPVTAVGFHQSDLKLLYAYVVGPERGLMRSRDSGGSWEAAGFVAEPKSAVIALAVGPGDRVALATTSADVLVSLDAGRTWRRLLDRGRAAGSARQDGTPR